MRLDNLPESDRIEDRRADAGGGLGFPGGVRGGGIGIGTVIILGLIGWALGIDPSQFIGALDQQPSSSAPSGQTTAGAPDDQMGKFVAAVLGSTEVQWQKIFSQA